MTTAGEGPQLPIEGGDVADEACVRLARLAANGPAWMVFNGTLVQAAQGDSAERLYQQWWRHRRLLDLKYAAEQQAAMLHRGTSLRLRVDHAVLLGLEQWVHDHSDRDSAGKESQVKELFADVAAEIDKLEGA